MPLQSGLIQKQLHCLTRQVACPEDLFGNDNRIDYERPSGNTNNCVVPVSCRCRYVLWSSYRIHAFYRKGTPYYLSKSGLLNATSSFLKKAFVALPMIFILVLGDIDISVGSTIALSSVIMAVSYYDFGVPMIGAVFICLFVSALCGFINGLLQTKFIELAPMIVTLGTQILYRGIAEAILKDQAAGNFPKWFTNLYWGKIGIVPYMLIIFAIFVIVFGVVLHKTSFGRRLYAIENNLKANFFRDQCTKNSFGCIYTNWDVFWNHRYIFNRQKGKHKI